MIRGSPWSLWTQFWHVPVRAERLALMRILLALALLYDQLGQYLPILELAFGPHGIAPDGLHDAFQLERWRVSVLFFNTSDVELIRPFFWIWVVVNCLWLVGWQTRVMNVLLWLLTRMFHGLNPNLLNAGDGALVTGILLLMLAPSGRALSLDAWLRHRRTGQAGPDYTPAWPVRILQLQLCVIYLTTGLSKLIMVKFSWPEDGWWPEGTWWDGTSIHNVLNDIARSRWSYAELPLPFWITAIMTYSCVWWETLFSLLVLSRWTRRWALWFGICFHLGIWVMLEVSGFSMYMLAFYGVWVSDAFWNRWRPAQAVEAPGVVHEPQPGLSAFSPTASARLLWPWTARCGPGNCPSGTRRASRERRASVHRFLELFDLTRCSRRL
jgi:hypothetical protein